MKTTVAYYIEIMGERYNMKFDRQKDAEMYWADHLSKVVVPETWKRTTIVCEMTTVDTAVALEEMPQARNTETWEQWRERRAKSR